MTGNWLVDSIILVTFIQVRIFLSSLTQQLGDAAEIQYSGILVTFAQILQYNSRKKLRSNYSLQIVPEKNVVS